MAGGCLPVRRCGWAGSPGSGPRRNAAGMNGKPWLLLKEAMPPSLNGLPNVVLILPFSSPREKVRERKRRKHREARMGRLP